MNEREFCCVTQLRLDDDSDWNLDLLNRICDWEIVEKICRVVWQDNVFQDHLLWRGVAGRSFTVRECYEVAHGERLNQDLGV